MIGMVAARAHQIGSRKSESSPNIKKTNQKIFRCIGKIVRQNSYTTSGWQEGAVLCHRLIGDEWDSDSLRTTHDEASSLSRLPGGYSEGFIMDFWKVSTITD